MVLRNHRVKYAFTFFVLFFLVLKLFTAEIIFSDDPTSILVLRLFPSLDNSITMISPINLEGYYVLLFDENGFVGEVLYHFIIKYLWWCLPLIGLIYYLYKKLTRLS